MGDVCGPAMEAQGAGRTWEGSRQRRGCWKQQGTGRDRQGTRVSAQKRRTQASPPHPLREFCSPYCSRRLGHRVRAVRAQHSDPQGCPASDEPPGSRSRGSQTAPGFRDSQGSSQTSGKSTDGTTAFLLGYNSGAAGQTDAPAELGVRPTRPSVRARPTPSSPSPVLTVFPQAPGPNRCSRPRSPLQPLPFPRGSEVRGQRAG